MSKPSKQASLDEQGNVRFAETQFGFQYGACEIERLHAERGGRNKGYVWFTIKTPRERLEVHISASGKVRIWSDAHNREVTK